MRDRVRSYLRVLEYRILRPWWWRTVLLERMSKMTDDEFCRLFPFGKSGDEWIQEFHQRARLCFFFHPRNQKDFFLQLLTQTQPYEEILSEADDVLANRFEALGSGKVELDWPVNWQRDFKSGKEWPLVPSWELDILDLANPSDVKVPWELSRFHQVWWLGKAYWLTRNEQYAEKFHKLVDDWIRQNPIGYGVNWHTAMEVAIRSCNWIAGYYFFCESKSISMKFWLAFFKSLYAHGVYIRNHLEYARRSGNHLLAGLVGLTFLGLFFRDTQDGRAWLNRGLSGISEEMDSQVYADGVNYEKSISYHRLVLELFSTATILCQHNGIRFGEHFMQRLERMFEFVLHYTRQDGSAPLVGDADDGRLFRYCMNDDVNDHRHVLSVGAILFERSDFKQAAGRFAQDALWLFGGEGFEKHQRLRAEVSQPGSRAFPDGGFYILRGEEAHLFVDAGDIGMRGRGGHGHNDTLSFEYWAHGELVVVDSGTYAYTFDVEARQEFRSTRAHNTVMVDGVEQAEFTGLWSIKKDRTQPRVLKWEIGAENDILVAEHHAYRPIVHRREFQLDKQRSRLIIYDTIMGEEEHTVESFLHVAPWFRLEQRHPQRVNVRGVRVSYGVEISTGTVEIIDTWFSPRYGVKQPNQTIRIVLKQSLPVTITVTISPSG